MGIILLLPVIFPIFIFSYLLALLLITFYPLNAFCKLIIKEQIENNSKRALKFSFVGSLVTLIGLYIFNDILLNTKSNWDIIDIVNKFFDIGEEELWFPGMFIGALIICFLIESIYLFKIKKRLKPKEIFLFCLYVSLFTAILMGIIIAIIVYSTWL